MALQMNKCLLKQLLKEKGLSQVDLSIMTGINVKQLNAYANNNGHMSMNTAMTIAHALKVHIEDLYTWKVVD